MSFTPAFSSHSVVHLRVGAPGNFFGRVVLQPFASNGELVWNAIDSLGGSGNLISIRGREE